MPDKKTDRKIFKKSDKSRIRFDLEFTPCHWWIRSPHLRRSHDVNCIYNNGDVYSYFAYSFGGILPACTI